MDDKKNEIMEALITIEEIKLKAQLRAIKKLSNTKPEQKAVKTKSMSQSDMVFNILKKEDTPLHITSIINKVNFKYNVLLDRESIVSALAKKVKKNDKFIRTDKNTFSIIKSEENKE